MHPVSHDQGSLYYEGLCPGGGLYPGGLCLEGSLSGGISAQGDLCPGRSLSREVPVRGSSRAVTSGRYTSYLNAFLFLER